MERLRHQRQVGEELKAIPSGIPCRRHQLVKLVVEGRHLSRSKKDSMVASWERIEFRPLKLGDLPLIHRWVNTVHVREWWDALPTLEAVAAEYTPQILGKEPTRSFIIEADAKPVGYIQSYRIADYPDYARYLGASDKTAGVDLFVGEVEYIGRGAGSAILWEFLRSVVFACGSVTECIIGPEIGNHRAIRSYEKVGFRYWKTVQIPGERAPEYLLRITRRQFEASSKIKR